MSNQHEKLSALERERQRLQAQLAQVEAAAAEETKRAEERERARRAILQQEAARAAMERMRLEQESASPPPAPSQPIVASAAVDSAATAAREAPVVRAGPAASPHSHPVPPLPTSPAPVTTTATTAPVAESASVDVANRIDAIASPDVAREPAAPKPVVAGNDQERTPSPLEAPTPEPASTTPTAPTAASAVTAPAVKPAPNAPPPLPTPVLPVKQLAAPVLDDDELDEDERGFSFRGLLAQAPPVLVSTVFHAVALIILALMTLAIQKQEPQGVVMDAATAPAEEEMLEELSEIELEPQELPELENMSVTVTDPDPGMISFADVTANTQAVSADVGDVELQPTTVGEIGALFGKDGQGMSDVGDGLKAAATFFGAKSVGSRFV
ncbi:MAG: hypothetical protein KDB14_31490, partial [Planctomycetales bacterium]|nr:hypothetical protein [Planctomycetales bacterium]